MELNEQQKKRQYLNSLHNDDMTIKNLPLDSYRILSDKYNDSRSYIPTIFLRLVLGWFPCEIKCSKKFSERTRFLDLKKNQVEKMIEIDGVFLFSGEKMYTAITAKFAKEKGEEIVSEKINKECYRLQEDQFEWSKYPTKLLFA